VAITAPQAVEAEFNQDLWMGAAPTQR
jgi:hypothetical protein